MHSVGIVHGDLHTSNIVMNVNKNVSQRRIEFMEKF